MKTSELVMIATVAIEKKMDYETLYYSDDMYGNEKYTRSVYEYVDECGEIGKVAFKEKYKEFKMFCTF